MARIRTIKPEFCSSPSTAKLSRDARLFFLQLLTEVDDAGRARDQRKRFAGVLYPEDNDVTPEMISEWICECERSQMIQTYVVDGDAFLVVSHFRKHQVINRPSPSKLPPPPDEESESSHTELSEDSVNDHGGLLPGKEQGTGKGKERKKLKNLEEGGEPEQGMPAEASASLSPSASNSDPPPRARRNLIPPIATESEEELARRKAVLDSQVQAMRKRKGEVEHDADTAGGGS